eukprot:TRINITY_DN50574_c0_g1_i1.p1 TRINITY_DN50574_c0_g1~~TRINITY_DN50574_c0_g1_i1.p1  ORF type:complete len:599 (-),score=134.19 TRINITY_DN50574_c0_g1_i1:28-1596(-)
MNGPVRLARGRRDGLTYAVKSFKKTGLTPQRRSELKSEAEIYLSLDHPHVARLEMVYESNEELHLVMEHMQGGELYDRLAEKRQYTEAAAASTTHQMLLAVAYLHAHHIVHRDLKLENFLYERENTDHIKLIDFGFAKFWDRGNLMSQACGSIHYVAPEVLAHAYNEKADMWSIGVIVYMLLTGSPPFHGSSDNEVLKKIQRGKLHQSSRFKKLSESARELVQAMLNIDPVRRLSAAEALRHRWLSSRPGAEVPPAVIGADIVTSLRAFARASQFRRRLLSLMAWSLSTEDRVELRKQFLLMDKSSTGTITHGNLMKILMENFDIPRDEAEMLFETLDADNNDEIEYSEFLAAALVGHVRLHEDVLRRAFARFDLDGDRRIDEEEMKAIFGSTLDETEIKELMEDVDTDGDGKIDYDEFLAYFHRMHEEGGDDRRPRQRRHSEKLGRVVDHLVLSTREDKKNGSDSERDKNEDKATETWTRKAFWRSKTQPQRSLPTLLRSFHPFARMGMSKPSKARQQDTE